MPESWLADRRQPRDSLATKIIFFVFLSTFVTSLAVSWISIHSTYSFLRRHLEHTYPDLLRRADEGLLGATSQVRSLLEHAAAEAPVQRLARGDDSARPAAEHMLRERLEAAGIPASVTLRDVAGATRLHLGSPSSAPERVPGAPPAAEPELRAVGGSVVESVPVGGDGGRPLGVLQVVFSPITAALRSDRPGGAAAMLYLVDDAGHVLAGGTDDAAPGFESFPRELLAAPPDTPLVEFRAADGRRAVGVHRSLPLAGWSLVVAQPVEQAFAPVFSVVTRIFVIDLAVVLLFSFLAYEITAAIVRPLEALADAARRISQGELEVEVEGPSRHDEIGLLTRTFNDMARRLRRNRAEIEQQHRQLREQNEQLQQANEVLEQLSITDGLTKLHNHRYFQETLTREIKRVSRTEEPLAMLLVDIDDFKALNDRLGHAAGDTVLVRIARILNESVRESDILARYGGEEFVVLATGTDLDGALFLAEKVRTAVAETSWGADPSGDPMRLTVSIGVAAYEGDRRGFFDAADRALYRAKAAGKNCVVPADAEGSGPRG
jgi:diguanylate cyclase (GGDEF)-like protein